MRSKLTPEIEDARGTLTMIARTDRSSLAIQAKVALGGPINVTNVARAVLVVVFPDGSTCEMESKVQGDNVRYRLDLRERSGELKERKGSCDSTGIPAVAGGTVSVEVDDDEDPSTPNVAILTGNF